MIAPLRIAEVCRLLAEGRLSQRAIAKMTGVSRGTIIAVATGRRRERAPRPDDDSLEPQGPPRRCPRCGGLVYMPCRACLLRERTSRDAKYRRRAGPRQAESPLQLELAEEHRRRYDVVHLKRMLVGEPIDDEEQGAYPC